MTNTVNRAWTRIAEPQRRGSLTIDLDRSDDLIESIFADRAVVAETLDVEQTSVGLEADLPQGGQVLQPLADAEVARVVDGGLGAKRAAFLVVLLDAGVLVVDVQRRNHAVGQDAGAEAPGVRWFTRRSKISCTWSGRPRSRFSRMTSSKKSAAVLGPVQNLGQRELRLQDGDVVAVAGLAIRRR